MNKTRIDKITPLAKEVSITPPKAVITQSRTRKALYVVAGLLSLFLALLGVVLPGLPCTPFALLSAAMFAKSSERLYNYLLNNKLLGPRIKNYQRRKGVTKKGKVQVILLMWLMVSISSFIIIKVQLIRIIILSAGAVGSIVVWFFVPEGKEPEDEPTDH